jgi:hypothetical protein
MKVERWIIVGLWGAALLAVLTACVRSYRGGGDTPALPAAGSETITATGSSTVTLPVVGSGQATPEATAPAVPLTLTLPVIGGNAITGTTAAEAVSLPMVAVVVTPTLPMETALAAVEKVVAGESLFVMQPGTPAAVQNFVAPDAGCNWAGIVGQVFDNSGAPLNGLIVEAAGTLEGREILALALTGSSQAAGPGGYQIPLGDHPAASQGSLFMQLFDLEGRTVSPAVPVTTYADCSQNVVVVNFLEVVLSRKIYFPLAADW